MEFGYVEDGKADAFLDTVINWDLYAKQMQGWMHYNPDEPIQSIVQKAIRLYELGVSPSCLPLRKTIGKKKLPQKPHDKSPQFWKIQKPLPIG